MVIKIEVNPPLNDDRLWNYFPIIVLHYVGLVINIVGMSVATLIVIFEIPDILNIQKLFLKKKQNQRSKIWITPSDMCSIIPTITWDNRSVNNAYMPVCKHT